MLFLKSKNFSIFSFLYSVKNDLAMYFWACPLNHSKKKLVSKINLYQGAESSGATKQQGNAQTRDPIHEQLSQC